MKIVNVKSIIGALVITVASLLSVNTANASCSLGSVKVIEILNWGTGGYVFVAPANSFGTNYYSYFYTTSQSFFNMAATALAGNRVVGIFGDGSCAAGSNSYAGNLLELDLY